MVQKRTKVIIPSVVAMQGTLEVSGSPRVAPAAIPCVCVNFAWFQVGFPKGLVRTNPR